MRALSHHTVTSSKFVSHHHEKGPLKERPMIAQHSYARDRELDHPHPRLSVASGNMKGGKYTIKRSQNTSLVQKNQSMERRIIEQSEMKDRSHVSPYKLINPVPGLETTNFHSRMSMGSKQATSNSQN